MRNALTQIKIKNAGDGKLEDGGGLRFVKRGATGKWVYRYSFLGKRREMGIGSWPEISLAEARKIRDQWANTLATGADPISERKAQQDEIRAQMDRHDPTFEELVNIVFEARKETLRGGGERGRWLSPLKLYMIPSIGKKRGSELTHRDIHEALKPIWRTKHPTAEKAVQRTRIVLRSAKRMRFPTDPEIVESAIEMLGSVNHVTKHMEFVPWQDIPDLFNRLAGTTSGLCNQWIILTLVRMDAARGARLDEIEGDTWTIPASRIKGLQGKVQDFRVPLSAQAMEIVENARNLRQEYLFVGHRGRPITDAAVEKRLKELEAGGTPHGFRTTFKTWCSETEACSWDVSETVLDHKIGGKVERSYDRTDLLDKRRVVMQKWADYVTAREAKVVKLRGA